MLIPNAEKAVVDIRKLRDYCLDPAHDEGKHKARLFVAVFGMTSEDAADLRDVLLQVIRTYDAKLWRRDGYGQRYTIDFPFEWNGKQGIIRSGWIIEHSSDIPRLT